MPSREDSPIDSHLLRWEIVPVPGVADLPAAIITQGAPFEHDGMPAEVGMLLPANDGPTALVDRLVDRPGQVLDVVTGLFLASAFFNLRVEASRLAAAGCRWVANLPSVDLHDPEFTAQLADVGLDRDREIAALAAFRERGFAIAAVAVDEAGARAAAAIEPDAVIVMPRVGDFAAGFPSLRQRQSAVQAVARTLAASDWRGRLLGLGESRDVESRELWPQGLDALVCRPRRW